MAIDPASRRSASLGMDVKEYQESARDEANRNSTLRDTTAGQQPAILERLPRRGLDLSWSFVGQRAVATLFAIWAALTIVFFLIMWTGSPAVLLAGPDAGLEEIERINRLYGFNRPLYEQYWLFLINSVTGHFPDSLRFRISPFDVIAPAIPLTLLLGGAAVVIGALIGLLVGYVSVMGRHWLTREVPLVLLTVVQSTPVFVIGILFVLFFALKLGWFPTGGSRSWSHLVLPAGTLSLLVAPPVARLFRASLVQQLEADHVRTAMAKQIPLSRVRWRHIALNALVPVIALLGLQAGNLLGGAVLTEAVFGWPGIGTVLVGAVGMQDYPVIIVSVILIAFIVNFFSFVADVLTAVFDPRTGIQR
jgi:ABC-type dipeptide/oligopeptide/nickel transport system permease component